MTKTLEAIKYSNSPKPTLNILDQLQLPHSTVYLSIYSSEDGWNAIKSMSTRGAPAIAIVAALSLVVELSHNNSLPENDSNQASTYILEKLKYLVTSRPTAVNLEDAAKKLSAIVQKEAANPNATGISVIKAYTNAAEFMLGADVEDNTNIGNNGADWLISNVEDAKRRNLNVVTHCNTGSLATAGYGTALGVIRSLQANRKLNHVYCTETRPYNQGSRLTSYELLYENISSTLITDSMAAALMRLNKDNEAIDAIIVGADRVTANGDTANKIGTYSLAVLARHHGVKFLVAAPWTSIDLSKKSGDEIKIEVRPDLELTLVKGPIHIDGKLTSESAFVSTAPLEMKVWNPSFDVTPAELIDAIITETGVVEKIPGSNQFDMEKFSYVMKSEK